MVLLANQDALSDEGVARLRAFVEAGGGLVATDRTGQLDDWRRERATSALTESFGLSGDKPQRRRLGRGRVAYVPAIVPALAVSESENAAHTGRSRHDDAVAPRNWRQIEAVLRWAAGGAWSFVARAPRGVGIEYRQGPQPTDRAVHVMNFSGKETPGRVQIEMAADGAAWSLQTLAPGRAPTTLRDIHPQAGRIRWSVGVRGPYCVCVLRRRTPGRRRPGQLRQA